MIGQGMPHLTSVMDALLREVDPLLPDLALVEIEIWQMRLNI
jgi:hypothetical protein